MRLLIVAIMLAGCERPPDPPAYFISQTVEYPDGSTVTRTFSGPNLPALQACQPVDEYK